MFLRNQFEGDGVSELPIIRRESVALEEIALTGYDKLSSGETDQIVHFFLDDYKFESLCKDPEPRIERLKRFRAVLSPDYSLYTEMPLAVQLFNTFRSRWCGAYLQSKGICVIPTVAWGQPASFWFCFDGIPRGSVVAVSTVGVRSEKPLFMQGYLEMMRRIMPKAVICYGEPFPEMTGKIIPVDYERTNHYKKRFSIAGETPFFVWKTYTFDEPVTKGRGGAGGKMPKFPGWDPEKPPGKDYEWRGRGTPASGKGSWFNPKTREKFYADLEHPDPLPPHWDYKFPGNGKGYRIFEDNSYEKKKIFDLLLQNGGMLQ